MYYLFKLTYLASLAHLHGESPWIEPSRNLSL